MTHEPTDPPVVYHTCACGAVTPLVPGVTRCIGCGVAVGADGGRRQSDGAR